MLYGITIKHRVVWCQDQTTARETNIMNRHYINECIRKALEMSREMLMLADDGDAVREDVGCGILYGTIRDSAYKIRALAEAEMLAHKRKGLGDQGDKEPLIKASICEDKNTID